MLKYLYILGSFWTIFNFNCKIFLYYFNNNLLQSLNNTLEKEYSYGDPSMP